MAVLSRRRLSNDEVRAVVSELIVGGRPPVDDIDIGTVITKVTDDLPRDEDSNRVRDGPAATAGRSPRPRAS